VSGLCAARVDAAIARAVSEPRALTCDELSALLADGDVGVSEQLFAAAREVKAKCGKTEILPRGLIEVSNVCAKDCLYCGIRRSNVRPCRYRMTEEEVADSIRGARRHGFRAVAFQAGELENETNTSFYERILGRCRGLEVTLSLGEQTEEVYRRWKAAAGETVLKYLIRIETSNRDLYSRIHPKACSFDRRLGCIRALKRFGYVTGSGVMIGLPGQTYEDLAADIVFFGRENLDMIGMGPFNPTPGTPLEERAEGCRSRVGRGNGRLRLSLKMIALTRLYLHGVNIVSATALDALDREHGRERGIAAGANVVMPNLTPARYIADYSLYPGKPQDPN